MKLAVLLLGAALAMQAQVTRRAPGFSLPDTKGTQHDLADYRGKVVLLDVIQSTCPKCLQLTKILDQMKVKYGDKIQLLSVVTMPDNLSTVTKYLAANNVSYPVLFDCGQMIASYLHITPSNPTVHFPHLFVIDRNGMIRREIGESDVNQPNVVAAIEAALK
jgi:peroxiredoxin